MVIYPQKTRMDQKISIRKPIAGGSGMAEKDGRIGRIGFVGIGLMGKPMCLNLVKAGYSLIVQGRNHRNVQEVVLRGAGEAFTPKEVARSSEMVFTSLPDDQVVEEIVLGGNGILEGMGSGSILVETSTVSPTTARKLAQRLEEKGAEMLDAPLSGGVAGASEGTLSIMVGGKPEVFERVLPVLQRMGKNITHVGGHGAGQVAKGANQIVVALTIEAVAEALIFAKKAGVDPEKVRKAMMGGLPRAASWSSTASECSIAISNPAASRDSTGKTSS
jgi:2-hydroxy-3-oxopropionate reductase